ncbi:hypothetical protein EHS25_001024 [Saitozyma podzolica]|uniref:Uncharacterized protein n=1 Tax=Saitozyma podzolica TaxID=1890683 RepID=A0A427YGY4_9TREE|nr:hypothetical protein EHS25_001024 [Saitozyma podzolica]
MATLFHALSGAVTGKVFLFDHTMNGWEVMEKVIRRRAGIIRVEWDPEERAQGDTHCHIAHPSTKGRPGWKHLTPRQLIAHLVNDGAQTAIHRALNMELPRPLPQSVHEMAFIIVMNTPLTFDAYHGCIAFSPVELIHERLGSKHVGVGPGLWGRATAAPPGDEDCSKSDSE